MKIFIVFAFLFLSSTKFIYAQGESNKLTSSAWTTYVESEALPQQLTIHFTEDKLFVITTCLFSKIGQGADVSATASSKFKLTDKEIDILETNTQTETDSETGNYCTSYTDKGFAQYAILNENEIVFSGSIWSKLVIEEQDGPSNDSGAAEQDQLSNTSWMVDVPGQSFDSRYTISFSEDGTSLIFTNTCLFSKEGLGKDISATVKFKIQLTETEVVITETLTKTEKDSATGNYCTAYASKGSYSYELGSKLIIFDLKFNKK